MKEEWRPIPGWEGSYEVSNLGRIRGVDRLVVHTRSTGKRFAKGKILRQHANDYGYMFVMGSSENRQRRIWVHRAVLEAFVEARPQGCPQQDSNPRQTPHCPA
ncbi:NUMOD4 domain-containing protein [Corynebacterium hesseae]